MTRRALSVVLVLSVILSFSLLTASIARADNLMNFASVASSCDSGNYTVNVSGQASQGILFDVRVVVWDADGTKLGENTFGATSGDIINRSITYSHTAVGPTVTYNLFYSSSRLEVEGVFADTATADASCKALPGCDVYIPLPSTAVVGEFKTDAAVYWEPGQLITNPPLIIQAGKTYYVIGQDQTGQYDEVLLGCDFVWVLKSTVGPNPDAVWQGKPLPTDIVD